MFSALSNLIFGNANFFGQHGSDRSTNDGLNASTWRDRKLCFDLRLVDLDLDQGEQLIACFYPIEDVKGNPDHLGVLRITNLRIVWICCRKRRVNLSIGWRTVTLIYEQNLKDSLCIASSSVFVLARYESTKYEFVFSHKKSDRNQVWMGLSEHGVARPESQHSSGALAQLQRFNRNKGSLANHLSPMYLDDPFDVVLKVWQAYKSTQLFRCCRANLTQLVSHDGKEELERITKKNQFPGSSGTTTTISTSFKPTDVSRLNGEEIVGAFPEICLVEARAIKYPGTLLLTNIRIIWIDNSLTARNLSIPYIRVQSIKIKHNERIVVSAHDYLASSTHVDFLIPRPPKAVASGAAQAAAQATKHIGEQMQNLCTLYKSQPRYGPESCDECIEFRSHLRPIERYFDFIDRPLYMNDVENFGPPLNEVQSGTKRRDKDSIHELEKSAILRTSDEGNESEDELYDLEADLNNNGAKLGYVNERPIDFDNVVIYSIDLGLAIEKPASGSDLESIWRIRA